MADGLGGRGPQGAYGGYSSGNGAGSGGLPAKFNSSQAQGYGQSGAQQASVKVPTAKLYCLVVGLLDFPLQVPLTFSPKCECQGYGGADTYGAGAGGGSGSAYGGSDYGGSLHHREDAW